MIIVSASPMKIDDETFDTRDAEHVTFARKGCIFEREKAADSPRCTQFVDYDLTLKIRVRILSKISVNFICHTGFKDL